LICQIYSLKNGKMAAQVAEAGADIIGVNPTPNNSGMTKEEAMRTAKEVFDAVRPYGKMKTALSIDCTFEEQKEIIEKLDPDILHICGQNDDATPELVKKLKEIKPSLLIEQAIGMSGPEAIDKAVYMSKFCDILILDSVAKNVIGVGAAGVPHNWDWDAEIVKRVKCRVIVAGGLGPENVADCIRKVHSWGVDSLTKTNVTGTADKDISKVREFCRIAKETAAECGC
jgi:phosphoribosylanthranilate isomerase